MSPSTLFLALVLCTGGASAMQSDHTTQGLKAAGLTHEEVESFRDHHRPERVHERRQEAADHPDAAAFHEWRAKHRAEHPDAAPAWSGKMPMDLLHHAIHMDPEDALRMQQQRQQAEAASDSEL